MPKPKAEKVLASDSKWTTVEIETAAGGEAKGSTTTQYRRPSLDMLQELMLSADKLDITTFYPQYKPADGEETVSQFLHRMVLSALDRKARADAYESLAQESTFISTGSGDKTDIMLFPLARLVRGINGMRSQLDTRMITAELLADKEPDAGKKAAILSAAREDAEKAIRFGPWKVAGRKLVEQGKAKENDATGMLELVAA